MLAGVSLAAVAATAAASPVSVGEALLDRRTGEASIELRCASVPRACAGDVVVRTGEGTQAGRAKRYVPRAGRAARTVLRLRFGRRAVEEIRSYEGTATVVIRRRGGRRPLRFDVGFAPPVTCRSGTTLAESPTARVFRVEDYGVAVCVAGASTHRLLQEETFVFGPSERSDHHRLAGRFVAYTLTFAWKCAGTSVRLVDLATGTPSPVRTYATGTTYTSDAHGCDGTRGVNDLEVHPSGAVAWIADPGDDGVLQVRVAAADGTVAVLDAATTIDRRSLTLEGTTLRWTRGGEPRSASL